VDEGVALVVGVELVTEYALPHDYEVLADAQDAGNSESDAEAEKADNEEAA
jgi:hypothetical protein